MSSNMVKPKKFSKLHLVYHFTVPLRQYGHPKMPKMYKTLLKTRRHVHKEIFFSIKMNTHFHKQNYNDNKTKNKKYD